MKRRLAGFGRVLSASRRTAFVVALLLAILAWDMLEQELGGVLPWTLQNVLAGVAFFISFGIAWLLGALGGTLGWFAGRRQGKRELGASAGVAGLWGGFAIGAGLTLWVVGRGAPPDAFVVLWFLLPLLGPWVATRWLAEPAIQAWGAAKGRFLTLSRLLGERMVLQRPVRLDARGLVLGLVAGLVVGVAALAGTFSYPEAVTLAQRVRLRNEPINTLAGPVELSRVISLREQGRSGVPSDRGTVILEIDDLTRAKLRTETSEAALNARLIQKLKEWRSGPVVLPLSPTPLTTVRVQRPLPAGRPPVPPDAPRPGARGPGRRIVGQDAPPPGAEALNPTSPPLGPDALRRAREGLPLLAEALRANRHAVLCLLPQFERGPAGAWFLPGLRGPTPVPAPAPRGWFAPLLASGRPLASAEFAPFHLRQMQTLSLTDRTGRWALPLLLATRGDPKRVSPDPASAPVREIEVAGRTLRLVEEGRLLVNVYGSGPGAIFPHVSYSAVLSGAPLYDRRLGRWVPPQIFFRDRTVFLDTLNQPSYDTPVGLFRATELLAMATDNVLTQNVLAPASRGLEMLLLLLFGALAGHLSIGVSPLSGAGRAWVLVLFFALATALLFVWPGLWIPAVSVMVAIGFAYLLVAQFVFTVDEMELERQRRERAQLEQEVAISRAIQTSLLPEGHVRSRDFEIVSRSDPAREVGGDFYNIFTLAPSRSRLKVPSAASNEPATLNLEPSNLEPAAEAIGIVLGDVSGKGVQGAMYMTVATTLVEARAEADVAPDEVLAVANAHLYPKIHRLRMFVTLFYGVLDAASGELEYASAGQVPPLLANGDGAPRYQPVRGIPLGALRRVRYDRHAVRLMPGDTLVLASDGFVEARNPQGEALGYDGFRQIVARHTSADPQRCVEGIFYDVERFTGDAEDQDDRTLVVIRHHNGTA